MATLDSNFMKRIISFAPFTLLLLFSLIIHFKIGTNFPPVWKDEAWFLFQAISFADDGTLATPMLFSGGEVMWMPPGYMIAMGWIFYFLDFLAISPVILARFVSFAVCYVALISMYLSLRRRNVRAELAYLAVFLVSLAPPLLANSNSARMESMVMMLGFTALMFYLDGLFVPWILICLVAPFFHPNGFYFLAAALPSFLGLCFKGRIKIDRVLAIGGFIVAVLWVAYAIYVYLNWVDFVSQMQIQFDRKLERSFMNSLLRSSSILALLFWCCWVIAKQIYDKKNFSALFDFESLFILALIFTFVVGMEMWYRGMWCAGLIYCLAGLVNRFLHRSDKFRLQAFVIVTCMLALLAFWRARWTWAGLSLESRSYADIVNQKICPELKRRFSDGASKGFIKMDPPGHTVLLLDCLPTRNSRKTSGWMPYSPLFGEALNSRENVYNAKLVPDMNGQYVTRETAP